MAEGQWPTVCVDRPPSQPASQPANLTELNGSQPPNLGGSPVFLVFAGAVFGLIVHCHITLIWEGSWVELMDFSSVFMGTSQMGGPGGRGEEVEGWGGGGLRGEGWSVGWLVPWLVGRLGY